MERDDCVTNVKEDHSAGLVYGKWRLESGKDC